MLFKKRRGRPPRNKLKHKYLALFFVMGILAIGAAISTGYIDPRSLSWHQIREQVGSHGLVLGVTQTDWRSTANLLVERLKGVVGERVEEKSKIQNPKSKIGPSEGLVKNPTLKFGVIADSHEDTQVFPKILRQMVAEEVEFFVHLGDFANAGELAALKQAKALMDETGLTYYVLPGDHDYNWQPAHNLNHFKQVFGRAQTNQVVLFGEYTLVFLDNSDNLRPADEGHQQAEWLREQLTGLSEGSMVGFTSKPPVSPYLPDKADPAGRSLLDAFKEYKIAYVFSGNTHVFGRYQDEPSGVEIITVGATGRTKNWLPQWVLVEIFDDGRFEITPKPYF